MGTAVVTWWPLPPLPAECHPQPACISGSSQRPECQPRSPGVELSVARHALFTLFTWRTRFLLRFRSPWGGRPEQGPPCCGLFGSFLPGPGSGMAFALSRKAMGSGEPGQRPELWVLVFPLLLFHDPSSPWKPIWDMLAWGTFVFTKHLFTDYFVLSSLQSCGSGTLINIFF